MNAWTLAWHQLIRRPVQTVINALIMGLGIAMVALLLLGQAQFEERMKRDGRGIDLVVGAAGSPMQIILSSVYHVDIPTGNIPLDAAREVMEREPAVSRVIPVALGDNFDGFRIVGTEHGYVDHYDAELIEGRLWKASMEAVVGAEVAAHTGLTMGDEFAGAHGLGRGGHVHDYSPYTVVGVLAYTGSVLDRLILTPVDSVWDVHEPDHDPDQLREHDHEHEHEHDHEHHDETGDAEHDRAHDGDEGTPPDGRPQAADRQVTALLVSYASPIAASRLPREIDDNTPWQSAEPAFQTARLATMIAPAMAGLRVFGGLLILASLLSVFAVLYQNLRERRYDFAVMRAIGAGPADVFRLTLVEGFLMVVIGLAVGLVLGHAATEIVGTWLLAGRALGLTGVDWAAGETWLVVGVLAAGALISLLPAWLAARMEAAGVLRRGF